MTERGRRACMHMFVPSVEESDGVGQACVDVTGLLSWRGPLLAASTPSTDRWRLLWLSVGEQLQGD